MRALAGVTSSYRPLGDGLEFEVDRVPGNPPSPELPGAVCGVGLLGENSVEVALWQFHQPGAGGAVWKI